MSDPTPEPTGAELIAAERQRQIDVEGWTPEHDDEHKERALTRAAECYLCWGDALTSGGNDITATELVDEIWPWHPNWWKPSDDPIHNLVKAGALIAAEIDRLNRAKHV